MTDKPLRADALRNRYRIIEVATDAFARDGAGASFEEIARRAGVGSGTLYRRFPTRAALFEAVYAEQAELLLAPRPVDSDAWRALEVWLRRFVDFIIGKRAFAEEMAHDTELVRDVRRRIYATAEPLIDAAQKTGAVRDDVTADDVLRMLSGIGLADYPHPGQLDRVIGISLRGLSPAPNG